MRKRAAWLSALLLAGILCVPALAEQPDVNVEAAAEEGAYEESTAEDELAGADLQVVSCPEQDFSTMIESGYSYDYHPDQGLCIYTGEGEGIPFVLIFKADGTGFDPESHFSNVLTPQMQNDYGERLTYVGDYGIWDVAGKQMPGQMYSYLIDGTSVVLLRLFDIGEDSFVCYTAKYREDDPDATLGVLATAAYCYQPDAAYYGETNTGTSEPAPEPQNTETPAPAPVPENTETPEPVPEPQNTETPGPAPEPQNGGPTDPTPVPVDGDPIDPGPQTENDPFQEISREGRIAVPCPESGFSVLAEEYYAVTSDGEDGVTIYTGPEGSIPYVIVFRSEDLVDGWEYLTEMYTPKIIEQYGEDLVDYREYEDFEVGGKTLPAGVYTYKLQGYLVDLIKVFDAVDGHTVTYTAKYIQDQGDETRDALDLAAASYQPDPYYYTD